jgi:hypothetical protein
MGGFFRRLYTYDEGEPSCLVIYGGVPYWIEFTLPGCITEDALIDYTIRMAGGLWISLSSDEGIQEFLDKLQETMVHLNYAEEED